MISWPLVTRPLDLWKPSSKRKRLSTGLWSVRDLCQVPVSLVLATDEYTDGNCVTSRGPGTALEFALQLVECLYGVEKAKEIQHSMLVPSY